jgi:acetyltransferase-like isoleucine patch superfamily enzyme
MQVPENPKFVSIGKIKIEDHVYIGASVTILKDVNIGEFSVVGSGSIVTRDIPSREIWGGVPARKIRDLSKDELLNPYGK